MEQNPPVQRMPVSPPRHAVRDVAIAYKRLEADDSVSLMN